MKGCRWRIDGNCGRSRRLCCTVVVHPHGQRLLRAHVDGGTSVFKNCVKAGTANARGASGRAPLAASKHARCSLCETEGAALEERFLGDDGDAAIEDDAGGRALGSSKRDVVQGGRFALVIRVSEHELVIVARCKLDARQAAVAPITGRNDGRHSLLHKHAAGTVPLVATRYMRHTAVVLRLSPERQRGSRFRIRGQR